MPIKLTLIGEVAWCGTPVVGGRPQELLATLALHRHDGATVSQLVEALWPRDAPANPAKALQVVVSRTRAATSADAIVRTPHGYRLDLDPGEIDATAVGVLAQRARDALSRGDAQGARSAADDSIAVGAGLLACGTGMLAEVRRRTTGPLAQARALRGLALSRMGEHESALTALEEAVAAHPTDEELLEALLRSESAIRGPAAALGRYESYRAALGDRLGTDPGQALQRVHRELLRADRPVRDGLQYAAGPLIGRDDDVRALHAMLHASRVVSIIGAGGLGKTRLAHVVGRESERSVVHFVELVGVASAEDVVGEVGSALGVRDSVSGRRVLTSAQRADVRSRIAQHLAAVPTLLILDNCEHVVDAVADLVAVLVASTGDLRVLTTSRAPLNIAAERVYALDQLGTRDGINLFTQRAVAARPNVALDDAAAAEIVVRLDGLPLAIELAAAKVRVMSVRDISRRLENRFALLRGGDRSAPDRHQTLIAVIDWSWNLLTEAQRRALRWLSVFHDGFTLDAAEAVIGAHALDTVQGLVDQSLLTVGDAGASVRYRMLETVREFGRMQLIDAGEDTAAARAQQTWACEYAARWAMQVHGADQYDAMDALRAEETNLADVLRRTLAAPDPDAMVVLLAAIGGYWSIGGEHIRVTALIDAVENVIRDWTPPPRLLDLTRVALSLIVANSMIGYPGEASITQDILRRLGPGSTPPIAGVVTVALTIGSSFPQLSDQLNRMIHDPNPYVAGHALLFLGHTLENAGDVDGAIDSATRALALPITEDGPWRPAMLHTQLAHWHAQRGAHATAAAHARAALPVLDRLGSIDDSIHCRLILAADAILEGDLDGAEHIQAEIVAADTSASSRSSLFSAATTLITSRAELALRRGDHAHGLALLDDAVASSDQIRIPGAGDPSGFEPWTLSTESIALTAYAMYADGDSGRALLKRLRGKALRIPGLPHERLDYPVIGGLLFGFGMWGLRRDAFAARDAVRLVVLADRLGYSRLMPTMAWDNAAAPAQTLAPGLIDKLGHEYGDRRGPELIDEVHRCITDLFS